MSAWITVEAGRQVNNQLVSQKARSLPRISGSLTPNEAKPSEWSTAHNPAVKAGENSHDHLAEMREQLW